MKRIRTHRRDKGGRRLVIALLGLACGLASAALLHPILAAPIHAAA